MKQIIIFLSLVMTINSATAQTPIGIKYDLNGIPLNGYFDPIMYSPPKKILRVHNSDSYETGYYYDSTGKKIEGLIKFKTDKIFFKRKEDDSRIKIKPNDIRHLVIGVDSFFVADKRYFKGKIWEKPEFVQYITECNGHIYAKHYHFTSKIGQQYAMQPPVIETFLVKHKDSVTWDSFSDNYEFKEKALKYFSHIPYLKDNITAEAYKSKNMLPLIKMAEYFEKYTSAKPIRYNTYWQEVKNTNKAEYTAIISAKTDSIWTFEYSKDNVMLYKANYSSFYPNIKNGDFIAYYPNGKTRQIISFLNNKPKEIKTFNKKGILNTHYTIIENKDVHPSKTGISIQYRVVNNAAGENILKANNTATLTTKDELNGVAYTGTYDKEQLSSVYRFLKKDTVFLTTNLDYDFKIKALQKRFNQYMSDKNYENAISKNAQGTLLVALLIDAEGYALESRMLNHIHPELDQLVNHFINTRLLAGATYRYKFKPYKKDKIKRYCEIVIPFEFSINRFYRRPVQYNYFHHWNFHNQIMNNVPQVLPKPPVRF